MHTAELYYHLSTIYIEITHAHTHTHAHTNTHTNTGVTKSSQACSPTGHSDS